MRVSNVLNRLNTEWVKLIGKISGKEIIHFIHVGKTAGSFINDAIGKDKLVGKKAIFLHPHNFNLKDIKEGEKFFFFLRDPLTRFISGFYSRKRKGMPKYNNPWTEKEKIAFEHFKTPNELAEALSSKNIEIKNIAIQSMNSIGHVNTNFYNWFYSKAYFDSRMKDVFFIGFQENFNEDVLDLFDLLKLDNINIAPVKKVHSNSLKIDKKLTLLAEDNLKNWYKNDLEFYNYCKILKTNNEF